MVNMTIEFPTNSPVLLRALGDSCVEKVTSADGSGRFFWAKITALGINQLTGGFQFNIRELPEEGVPPMLEPEEL